MSVFTAAASVLCLFYVALLLFGGVHLDDDCRYFVPVRHHPSIYACSATPKPVSP